MSDLAKTVLGGAWGLVVGWVLPTFLTLQAMLLLLLPQLRAWEPVDRLLDLPWASQQLALLGTAVVVGLVMAAAQAPLYRLLEGYALWPERLAQRATDRHRRRRQRLVAAFDQAATTGGVRSGLRYERAARYPPDDRQLAPTQLGNSIRRFETYAGDRYKLDSQLLWHHLSSTAPERAVKAVDAARTNVDFFICLIYGAAATALLAVVVLLADGPSAPTLVALGLGVVVAPASYRLAVLTTDEWDAAVRALVDLGRPAVAEAFGLTIPTDFTAERHMWQVINTLVRRPYAYSESKNVAGLLTQARAGHEPDSEASTQQP